LMIEICWGVGFKVWGIMLIWEIFFFSEIEEQREREVRAEKEEREVFVTNDFFCEG
jgi:hypothetical protein